MMELDRANFRHENGRVKSSDGPVMAEKRRNTVRRVKQRAHYDRDTIHAVLDASWIAHVAFCVEGQPFVIPMLYVRDGDSLLLHGSIASRLLRTLADGVEASACVTLLDGLVLARSHFHHSTNYRSVVVFGTARAITAPAEKAAALAGFVDAILPGRAAESRPADANELAATLLLRLTISDASAKIRTGPPKDDPADLALPIWAGVVPLRETAGAPIAAADVPGDVDVPPSVRAYLARQASVA